MNRPVDLLEPCESKEEADDKVHFWAAVVKQSGRTEDYGAKVLYRRGWGVWLIKRGI